MVSKKIICLIPSKILLIVLRFKNLSVNKVFYHFFPFFVLFYILLSHIGFGIHKAGLHSRDLTILLVLLLYMPWEVLLLWLVLLFWVQELENTMRMAVSMLFLDII